MPPPHNYGVLRHLNVCDADSISAGDGVDFILLSSKHAPLFSLGLKQEMRRVKWENSSLVVFRRW